MSEQTITAEFKTKIHTIKTFIDRDSGRPMITIDHWVFQEEDLDALISAVFALRFFSYCLDRWEKR